MHYISCMFTLAVYNMHLRNIGKEHSLPYQSNSNVLLSPYTVCNINKLERCQRWFTKCIQGLYNTNYFDHLAQLGLESLQCTRLKYDLVTCYKIIR